ncbi:hypothetical protein V6N11_065354 [Hibiscus sabdariffa]|uniref:CID domain-containing protein n=1 Tax=Hibiscus sabdariffa TaxID=183260 RepID=A0ABR2QGS7_9ROSI
MENTRRSFDRSRGPGLKKPRLTEDLALNPNARPFPQRTNPAGPVSALRFRFNGPDMDDMSPGGGAYEPQPVTSPATATISELVRMSMLPRRLLLPSAPTFLSIVKNIGRDYIKHFAVRLPEVFCKAYRQVDPPVHQSLRHLFGTWKGVFRLHTLQVIENELSFAPTINGSSSRTTTSRSDPLSQCPPHSIHVNPKYLEKQRLQQSSRAKGTVNDMTETLANSKEDYERPDRVAITAGWPYGDPSIKMNTYGLGVGRASVTEAISNQRNGFNIKHGSQNYLASKSVNADPRSLMKPSKPKTIRQVYCSLKHLFTPVLAEEIFE